METWQIAVVVIAILVVVAVGWIWIRGQRTQKLTEQFGPEYQRTVESAGDTRAAERELEARRDRVKGFEIRALSPGERDRFLARWQECQAHFVDDPSGAISQADVLVQEVMRARGFPMVDFEQRAADISVDHPHMLDDYRAAHNIAERHAAGGVETENLRQAMVHYRALFEDLLETDSATPQQDAPAEQGRVAEQEPPAEQEATAEQDSTAADETPPTDQSPS